MSGFDALGPPVPYTGPVQVRSNAPPPEQRVVEQVEKPTLQSKAAVGQDTDSAELRDLVQSAQKFAQVLATTGDVQIASIASGFPLGRLDTYA
jgi:hypothetical protein